MRTEAEITILMEHLGGIGKESSDKLQRMVAEGQRDTLAWALGLPVTTPPQESFARYAEIVLARQKARALRTPKQERTEMRFTIREPGEPEPPLEVHLEVDKDGNLDLRTGKIWLFSILRATGQIHRADDLPEELGFQLDEHGQIKVSGRD